jgi:hypothetical protein
MAEETISVVVATAAKDQASGRTKGGIFAEEEAEIADVPVSKLRANVANECRKFVAIISEVKDESGYKLSEAEVGFEISGEGGVSFIGTAKVGARASLKMKFVRS